MEGSGGKGVSGMRAVLRSDMGGERHGMISQICRVRENHKPEIFCHVARCLTAAFSVPSSTANDQ